MGFGPCRDESSGRQASGAARDPLCSEVTMVSYWKQSESRKQSSGEGDIPSDRLKLHAHTFCSKVWVLVKAYPAKFIPAQTPSPCNSIRLNAPAVTIYFVWKLFMGRGGLS